MNDKQIDALEKCEAQIEGLYEEIGVLSKKNPSNALNKFKLKFVNTVLAAANELLDGKYRPFDDFTQFEEDGCPSNSDVVMILSQYLRSMDKFRQDHTSKDYGTYYWKGTREKRQAKRPRLADM